MTLIKFDYKPKFYMKTNFSAIPFDLNNLDLIDGNIYFPVEDDKQIMSQLAFDEAIELGNKRKEKLLFTNTFVNYESCDCNGGYPPCDHPNYPSEIEVKDKEGNILHVIDISGNTLEFGNEDTYTSITGLKNFTYADFIRFCQLCGIKLESNYILK